MCARIESPAARAISSPVSAATGAAAAAGAFAGLAGFSVTDWVGSNAAVSSSVVAGGQLDCAQLGPRATSSKLSNQPRQLASTVSGSAAYCR